jgi:hypothetical protein
MQALGVFEIAAEGHGGGGSRGWARFFDRINRTGKGTWGLVRGRGRWGLVWSNVRVVSQGLVEGGFQRWMQHL